MADKTARTFIPSIEPELDRLIAENGLSLGLFQLVYQAEDLTERLKKALLAGRFEIKGGYQNEQPELAQLGEDTEVILRTGGVDMIVSAKLAFQQITQIIDRQSKERFTFNEIAIIIAERSGGKVDYIRDQQEKAFENGRLVFFRDGLPVDPETYDHPMGVWGFDYEYSTPEKINNWLSSWGAEYRFPSKSEAPQERPKQKLLLQEEAIINWLNLNGFNPLELPKNEQGKRGVRADCRDYFLAEKPYLFTKDTFKKTWQRLLSSEQIKYVKKAMG